MFAKLGALALFASLASALSIALDVDVVVPGVQVDIDAVVATGDVGQYDLLLAGVNISAEILDTVDIKLDTTILQVTVPETTPVGDDYVIQAVRTDDLSKVVAETKKFKVEHST